MPSNHQKLGERLEQSLPRGLRRNQACGRLGLELAAAEVGDDELLLLLPGLCRAVAGTSLRKLLGKFVLILQRVGSTGHSGAGGDVIKAASGG